MSILTPSEQSAAESANEAGILPEADYACRIVGVEKWKSGSSLVWKFRLDKGQPGEGREIYDWTGLSERGIWRTKERFLILGVDLDAGEEAFMGMPVMIHVEVGTNEQSGEPKNKVTAVTRVAGGLVEEAVEKLDATADDKDIPF